MVVWVLGTRHHMIHWEIPSEPSFQRILVLKNTELFPTVFQFHGENSLWMFAEPNGNFEFKEF